MTIFFLSLHKTLYLKQKLQNAKFDASALVSLYIGCCYVVADLRGEKKLNNNRSNYIVRQEYISNASFRPFLRPFACPSVRLPVRSPARPFVTPLLFASYELFDFDNILQTCLTDTKPNSF
jgi:hypothetical protein